MASLSGQLALPSDLADLAQATKMWQINVHTKEFSTGGAAPISRIAPHTAENTYMGIHTFEVFPIRILV